MGGWRDQCHIGVGRHRDRGDQLRGVLVCVVDCGRAVRTADNTDRSGLLRGEKPGCHRNGKRYVDTQLGRCTEQQADRVGHQRAEVGHRTDPHKNQAGEQAALDAHIDDPQDARFVPRPARGSGIIHQVCKRQVRQQHTKRDRQQQKRLKLLDDRAVEQGERDQDHDTLLPGHRRESRLPQGFGNNLKKIHEDPP